MPKFIKENSGYLLSLTLVGFFLYAFNLHNPLFWDDADWILNNPALHALSWVNIKFIFSHDALAGIGGLSNYYRPFLFITFLFNYVISGPAPVLYHLINNSIHIANALMLFYLLTRWINRRAGFLAALIFLIHPLQTEAFTYVAGRGDPLSVAFMLAGIIFFIHHRRWLAGLAMILAILTKETAVLFPLYLALGLMAFEYKLTFWRSIRRVLRDVWPYLSIAVIYGLLRLTALNFQNTLNFYTQQNFYSTHLSVRLYTFFHVLLVYGRLMVWPVGLHMDRDLPVHTSFFDWQVILGFSAVLLIILIGFVLYKFENDKWENGPPSAEPRRGRGKSMANGKWKMVTPFQIWLFGWGIFFINLGPTSGIVPANARIYEHWLYFPIAGTALIAGFYIDKLLNILKYKSAPTLRSESRPLASALLVIGLIVYFVFLGTQTIKRNILWGDTEAFYKNILVYEPDDVRVLNNLGNWYSDHGDNISARPYYERAIVVDPTQPAPYYNIGNISRDAGDLANAEKYYLKAIEVNPRFHYAYENIAAIYVSQHLIADALAILEKLQHAAPSDVNAQRIELLKKSY